MKIYKVTDYTGCYSIHYADNEENAIYKHLIHYSLLWLDIKPKVEELKDVDKSLICQDIYCNLKRKE